MPKISVVIPVYNAEKYLPSCIESVASQTMQDIEILLIDDGSTDSSGYICDEAAREDTRIRVFHNENMGLSGARNFAIGEATADYIMFVDSDDIVSPDFCMHPYLALAEAKGDLCIFKLCRQTDKDKVSVDFHATSNIRFNAELSHSLTKGEALKKIEEPDVGDYACDKLYSKMLFSEISFPLNRLYEDMATAYRLIEKSKSIIMLDEVLYFYRKTPGSITESRSMRHLASASADAFSARFNRYRYYEEHYPELLEHEKLYLFDAALSTCIHNIKQPDSSLYNNAFKVMESIKLKGKVPLIYRLNALIVRCGRVPFKFWCRLIYGLKVLKRVLLKKA